MSPAALTPQQRKSNARLGWALAVIVALVFVGFIVKSAVFGF
jgi:hypothetical protein